MVVNELLKREISVTKNQYLLYARKSSESEDKQLASVQDQIDILTKLAEDKGLPIAKIFTEEKSAKAPGRPVFNELLAMVNKREDIKGIVAWKLNRLSRNPIDSGILQWLLQSGKIVEIVTPSKTYSEADSDLLMSMEGAVANKFIRDLREDTKRGINAKIRKGIAPQLAPPGYYNDKTLNQGERDIKVHPIYFSLVREIFELALTGKWSVTDLTIRAGELGIITGGKLHNHISHSRLGGLLHDRFYTGMFNYDGVLYQGIHTPMISQAEFDAIQKIYSSRYTSKTKYLDFPLSNNVRCKCGRGIVGERKTKHYKNGKSQEFVYYRCTRQKYNSNSDCPRSRISEKDLLEQASKLVGEIKISPQMVDWAIRQLNEENDAHQHSRISQVEALRRSLDDTTKRLDNLIQLKLSPLNGDGSLLSDQEYSQKRSVYLTDKQRVQEAINAADKGDESWMDIACATFNFAAQAQDLLDTGTIEQKKDVLRIFGACLTLNDRTLEIQPRTPFIHIREVVEMLKPKIQKLGLNNIALMRPYAALCDENIILGERRDSNPQPLDPQSSALPLSYAHHGV